MRLIQLHSRGWVHLLNKAVTVYFFSLSVAEAQAPFHVDAERCSRGHGVDSIGILPSWRQAKPPMHITPVTVYFDADRTIKRKRKKNRGMSDQILAFLGYIHYPLGDASTDWAV